jgi:hypothetical protein
MKKIFQSQISRECIIGTKHLHSLLALGSNAITSNRKKKIIELSGLPIAQPPPLRTRSSGRPSPTSAEHVLFDFTNLNNHQHHHHHYFDQTANINQFTSRSKYKTLLKYKTLNNNNVNNNNVEGSLLKCIVDGGDDCDVDMESTVLDLNHKVEEKGILRLGPVILRPGSVTLEKLLPYIPNLRNGGEIGNDEGRLNIHCNEEEEEEKEEVRPATRSGLKYVHYSH